MTPALRNLPESAGDLAADYLAVADSMFAGVKAAFSPAAEARLAFTLTLADSDFTAIEAACRAFVERTLTAHRIEWPSGNPYSALRDRADRLSNLTANGALMPRTEAEPEFNDIQRLLADLFDRLGAARVFDWGQCPVNLRISKKTRLDALAAGSHPYPSLKPHSDVWAGEPVDFVNCFIPVYVDGEALNLEMREATRATEANALRAFPSYVEALKTVELGAPYDLAPQMGQVLFVDSRLIHRTLYEKLGTVRASLDFRFRPRLDAAPALKARLDAAPAARNVTYIPYDRWRVIGTRLWYRPGHSFAEAPRGAAPGTRAWVNHRYSETHRPSIVPIAEAGRNGADQARTHVLGGAP